MKLSTLYARKCPLKTLTNYIKCLYQIIVHETVQLSIDYYKKVYEHTHYTLYTLYTVFCQHLSAIYCPWKLFTALSLHYTVHTIRTTINTRGAARLTDPARRTTIYGVEVGVASRTTPCVYEITYTKENGL